MRKGGSGRPKTARTADRIVAVSELICSQEDQPGSSKSTRQIAAECDISHMSVYRIAKQDLSLTAFKRIPAQVLNAQTCAKRLARCTQLLRRLTDARLKRTFFTDEKVFYLDPPVTSQRKRVWAVGKKSDIPPQRLLQQRAKFSAHVMVSAGISYCGKGRLHFVPDKAKINSEFYVGQLLPKLLNDCNIFSFNFFI